MTAPDVIRISGPEIENFGASGIVEGFGGAADDLAEIGAGPSCLQQEIVRPAERQQPAFDSVLRMFSSRRVAQALGGDGAHGRERILDAVVQLFEDQLLQLVGRLALLGVDAGLGEQTPGIDLGLRKQQPQADIFRRQKVLVRFCAASEALVCTDDRLQDIAIISLMSWRPH